MISQKKIIGLGFLSYGIASVIVLISSYILLVLLPKHEDWELFSYNLYGSIILFTASIVLLAISSFFMKNIKLNNVLILIILIILLEVSSIIIAENSIILTVFTTMAEDGSWFLIAYPVAIVIGYFISKKALKITF